jgi:hypothetical protein
MDTQGQLIEILSRFDNMSGDDVRAAIYKKKTVHEALIDIRDGAASSFYPFSLHDTIVPYVVPRNGDVILGFYASAPMRIRVRFGSSYWEVIELQENEFKYAMFGVYPFILIYVDYTNYILEVLEGNLQDLHVVYGMLPLDERRFLASNSFITCRNDDMQYIYYSRTMTGYPQDHVFTVVQVRHVYMPKLTAKYGYSLAEMMAKSKERVDILRQELMAMTWHPSRFVQWCLPYDEGAFFEM